MTNAPERIWIEDERPEGGSCHVYDEPTPGVLKYATEYIRADLALPAVQPNAKPKPFDCECGQVGPCKAPFCTPCSAQPHVNETSKSEHDAANVLTLTAERDRLAAAVDSVMADRKRILEERDRGFVMVMERAERAEAEVARLTALLPHPGETAQEVMWRNFQRGVRLEELAKAAGITKERARLKLRKAEARGIRYE